MKTCILLFAVVLVIFYSCENNDDKSSALTTLRGESGISYFESLAKWRELKKVNGNSYIYQTTFNSWTGFCSVTELKIEEGIVTERVYKEFKTNESNGQKEITDSYTETKVSLGTHERGANIFTIDDLYNSCAGDYLIADQERNTLYFETELSGLMTLCGFVPEGCMDDCYRGISISSFHWID